MFSLTKHYLPRTLSLLLCLILLTLTGLSLPGCSSSKDQPTVTDLSEDDPCAGFPETYGRLKYLRQTTHPELKREYALLVEKEHTPCQLLQYDKNPNQNSATAIQKAISKNQADEIIKKTKFLTRRKRFEFNPLQLKKIKKLVEDYEYKTLLVTEAMELPNCIFELQHPHGLMADDTFVEQTLAASRLQAIAAANFLFNTRASKKTPSTEGKPREEIKEPLATNHGQINPSLKETLGCIQTIFKLANRLGEVKQARARLTAETIREEASFILEALVHDPRCNKATLQQLQKIIQEELADWNRDAEMWIGDRALGLYIYEVVRDGLILSVLSEEEEEAFRQEGTLDYLVETTQETADEDELYYLKTMRHLIDNCDRDFYKRPLLGSHIIEDLESRRDTPNYPMVAAKILLSEVDNALMIQMADLARIRAWSVALDVALGNKPKDNINPINGEPYHIIKTGESVTVRTVPEGERDEIEGPLDTESKVFLTNELKRPVVIPLSAAGE